MSDINADQVINDVATVAKDAVHADPKPFYKSKTFWANTIAVGANYVAAAPPKYAVPALAGLNVLLRFLTTQPVSVK